MDAEGNIGDRVKLIEERRKASEGVLWHLPALSLTAQAFLLNAGLSQSADRWARALAGSLGIVVVLATATVLVYQGLRLSILVRWVDQAFHTTLDEKELKKQLRGQHQLKSWQRSLLWCPDPFWAWTVLLAFFLAADLDVLARGLGWL